MLYQKQFSPSLHQNNQQIFLSWFCQLLKPKIIWSPTWTFFNQSKIQPTPHTEYIFHLTSFHNSTSSTWPSFDYSIFSSPVFPSLVHSPQSGDVGKTRPYYGSVCSSTTKHYPIYSRGWQFFFSWKGLGNK